MEGPGIVEGMIKLIAHRALLAFETVIAGLALVKRRRQFAEFAGSQSSFARQPAVITGAWFVLQRQLKQQRGFIRRLPKQRRRNGIAFFALALLLAVRFVIITG
ncbi:hypothetical protein D3C71_1919160 [compost metagenome]